jgi:dihydropyrimidinase
VIDFAFPRNGELPLDAVRSLRQDADEKAVIDYSLHCGLVDASDETLQQLPKLVEEGVCSFKLVMGNRPDVFLDDGQILAIMIECSRLGSLPGVHAENAFIAEYNKVLLLKEMKTAPKYHAECYSRIAEVEAVQRAITLAASAKSSLYIYHLTTTEGLDAVHAARTRGRPVFAETCPHYLVLTDEVYHRPDGINYIMGPPLRKQYDCEALWAGLRGGALCAVGSDDAAFTLQAKRLGEHSFDKVPNGVPGVDVRFVLMYSEGVHAGRMSVNRFVDIVATSPAEVFGLYPQKGIIQVGSDADIVLFDPDREVTLAKDTFLERSDYSIYDGRRVVGFPVAVLSRGKVVARDGRFVGEDGRGRFIPALLPGGEQGAR